MKLFALPGKFFYIFLLLLLSNNKAAADQKLFWVSINQNNASSSIFSSNLDGSDKIELITLQNSSSNPFYLSVDDINQKLYWTSISPAKILRSNLDGTNIEIVASDIVSPRFISVDPIGKQVFWTELSGDRVLNKINFDLTGKASSKSNRHYSIAAAPNSGLILISDLLDGRIEKKQLNDINSNIQTVISEVAPVNALTILHNSNHVVWFSNLQSRILKLTLPSGNTPQNIASIDSKLNTPAGFAVENKEQNIYWTDSIQQSIIKTSLNPADPNNPILQKILDTPNPAGIAISCGVFAPDSDGDRFKDCEDLCVTDPLKSSPGICGCGVTESNLDSDFDGIPDCLDSCPSDKSKTEPGACGCGKTGSNADSDSDGIPDCLDSCPNDNSKTEPGACGCGTVDSFTISGALSCGDLCPEDQLKNQPGACGCGKVENLTISGILCDDIRTLYNNTLLTSPPIVTVKDNSVTLILEKFARAVFQKKKRKALRAYNLTASAKKPKISIRYVVNIKNKSAKTKNIQTLNSKRNVITVKNLSPGNYNVNYKAQILKDGKVVSSTNRSPSAGFTIN